MSSNLILPPNARIDGTLSNITASVVNTRSGMGTARDKSTYNFAGAFLPFTQQERGVIHAGSFEVKRVTEKLPMHMTAKGWTVEIADGKPELVAEFDKYARRLKLQSAFKKAEFYRNLHDGAVIFLLIDDGRKPDEPVDEARIRTIHPITPKYVLDRWKVTPSDQTEEPEFYSVMQYSNVLSAKGDRLEYEYADWRGQVHHTRCLRFDDGLADDWIRRLNQGWSPGVFHQFLKPFLDYFSGFQALGAMLQDASLFTYAINGLMQQILDGNEKLIRDRLTENWLDTSNYGAIIHDAEHEKVGFTERSLAGWDSSLSRLENRLVAASGLPHSVLLGRAGSGGGLDGNGESEAKLMVETTTDQQENSFRDKLEYLYRLITLAKDGPTKGKEVDHKVVFNPIYTPTPQEQAELESLVIQKDVQAIGAGIYTPEDALRSHYSTNEFNPSITIDWDKKEQEFAQQQEQAAAEEAALAEQESAIDPEEEAPPEELPPEDEGFNLEEFELEGQTDSADPHLDDRYSHINFYPPTFMRKAARRGLELRRKFGRGGLSIQEASDQGIGSGVARARDIANGAQLSPDTIKRMHAYFSRHQRDKKKGWDDPKNPTNGFIAWNLWGDSGNGKGWRWVKDRIAQMELADLKAKEREDGFDQVRDRLGRFARTRGAELAEHLSENVISWGTGKVLGGLVAQIGTAHGIDPDLSKRLGETAVQALTATALHARHTRDPLELGEKFISEAAAAFLGKASHSAVDDSIAGADEHVRAIASLITGKTVGAATAASVSRGLRRQSKAIGRLLATQRYDDVCGDVSARTDVRDDISRLEQAALFDLTLAGYLLAEAGDRADAKGQGVACGKSFISPRAKCSPEKARSTPKEALQKTTENRKKLHALKREVAQDKGKKATDIPPANPNRKMPKVGQIALNIESGEPQMARVKAVSRDGKTYTLSPLKLTEDQQRRIQETGDDGIFDRKVSAGFIHNNDPTTRQKLNDWRDQTISQVHGAVYVKKRESRIEQAQMYAQPSDNPAYQKDKAKLVKKFEKAGSTPEDAERKAQSMMDLYGNAYRVAAPPKTKKKRDSQGDRQDSIRPSCWDCVNKHVGSAIVLMQEAEHGYPEHKLLAIGHLAQAEEESLRQMPDVAAALREIRRRYHAGDAIDVQEFYDALGMNADAFVEDNHPRGPDGKFIGKDQALTEQFGKARIRSLRDWAYSKQTREESKDRGEDPDHPAAGWDPDTHADYLNAYRQGGDRAVGEYAMEMGLDFDSEGNWGEISRLARQSLKSVDWDTTSQYAKDLADGKDPKLEGNDYTRKVASVIKRDLDIITDPGDYDEADGPVDRQIADRKQRYLEQVGNGASLKKVFDRAFNVNSYNFDEDLWREFAEDAIGKLDPETIGRQLVKTMKLKESKTYEEKVGHGLQMTPYGESEHYKRQFRPDALPPKAKRQRKIRKVMREFKEGKLKSSAGDPVTDRRQAIAIALSMAGLRADAFEPHFDKPCGKSHIADNKKCSPEKLRQLTADLKAGDEGAKRRVAEGKKKAAAKQKLRREVERDRGKKPTEIDQKATDVQLQKRDELYDKLPIAAKSQVDTRSGKDGRLYLIDPQKRGLAIDRDGKVEKVQNVSENQLKPRVKPSDKPANQPAKSKIKGVINPYTLENTPIEIEDGVYYNVDRPPYKIQKGEVFYQKGDQWIKAGFNAKNPYQNKASIALDIFSAQRLDPTKFEKSNLDANTDAFPTYRQRLPLPGGAIAGLTHLPGDVRHGRYMRAGYGVALGTYGLGRDGKSLDLYVGDAPESDQVWRILQTTPDGDPDEYKYMVHCRDKAHARKVFIDHAGLERFGAIEPAGWEELRPKKSRWAT